MSYNVSHVRSCFGRGGCRTSWWSSCTCVWSFSGSLRGTNSSPTSTSPSLPSSRSRETSRYVSKTLVTTPYFRAIGWLPIAKVETPYVWCQHHHHETLWFMVSEIIRSLLRHPPVVPESGRGGEFGEAALWSVLPCGILRAGEFTRSIVTCKFCWSFECCL